MNICCWMYFLAVINSITISVCVVLTILPCVSTLSQKCNPAMKATIDNGSNNTAATQEVTSQWEPTPNRWRTHKIKITRATVIQSTTIFTWLMFLLLFFAGEWFGLDVLFFHFRLRYQAGLFPFISLSFVSTRTRRCTTPSGSVHRYEWKKVNQPQNI